MNKLKYLLLISIAGCASRTPIGQSNIDTFPACIRQNIESIKSEAKWNPPAEINMYEYKGKNVYLLSAPCCDFYITAVDEQCNTICAPSGGITGKGDSKCPDFGTEAKFVKLIWKDER